MHSNLILGELIERQQRCRAVLQKVVTKSEYTVDILSLLSEKILSLGLNSLQSAYESQAIAALENGVTQLVWIIEFVIQNNVLIFLNPNFNLFVY
jgi:formate-dependent nitrite reductase membrane component NrfD